MNTSKALLILGSEIRTGLGGMLDALLPELEAVDTRESQLRAIVAETGGLVRVGGGEVDFVGGLCERGDGVGVKLSWSTGIGYEILGLEESTE